MWVLGGGGDFVRKGRKEGGGEGAPDLSLLTSAHSNNGGRPSFPSAPEK